MKLIKVILLLPLLLLVTRVVARGQQATITAPQGSTINNATVTVFQPRFLSGTWNFVNGFGNVSGVITFGNQDLCPNCKWNWQHDASFSGIFSGNPVSGTYTWETVPSPPSVYKLAPTSSLSLMYQYHHKDVIINGNLNFINPAHMELTDINHWKSGESVVGSDYTVATGLHLHQGDIMHRMRGGTALNILSPAITHTTNESCPHRMYLD
jgi:hypothetical protein